MADHWVRHLIGGHVALDDGRLVALDVETVDTTIRRVVATGTLDVSAADEVVDVSGRIVAPGFIDVQLNGGWGHDFTRDPESIDEVAAQLPATGTTSFVPTIVTCTDQRRAAVRAAWAARAAGAEGSRSRGAAADAVGLHLEGPMISPTRAGAHDRARIALPADVDLADWRADAGVVMVTVAPELPGAAATIAELVRRGIVVAIGHTDCNADEFEAARAAGARLVTHLFNAMAPFDHRAPGPIGATLADPTVVAGLICDGIHVDPVAVRVAWRALGPDRLLLVTDATAALGAATSRHRLGDVDVVADERGVRTVDGVLAGSSVPLDEAVRNLMAFTGCSPAAAIRAATATPADVLGLTDRGRVLPGARADLVVLDAELGVEQTMVAGATVWSA
jgi:N-acetylglucosamine-6-phosphate deacetylase